MACKRHKIFDRIKKYLEKSRPNESALYAPFQKDIRYIFQNFEEDFENSIGFTSSIRSLLVNNILNNLNFQTDLNEKLSDRFSKIIMKYSFTNSDNYVIDLDNHFKISTGIKRTKFFIFF